MSLMKKITVLYIGFALRFCAIGFVCTLPLAIVAFLLVFMLLESIGFLGEEPESWATQHKDLVIMIVSLSSIVLALAGTSLLCKAFYQVPFLSKILRISDQLISRAKPQTEDGIHIDLKKTSDV